MDLIVIVSYLDNLLQFEFDENANVGDLKRKIKERTGLDPAAQQLVWGNAGISDTDITSDIPLVAMGLDDAIMLFEKEVPKPSPQISQPSLSRESSMGRGSFNLPSQTSFLGNQQNFYAQYDQFADEDEFHPFLDGRTTIGTNPNTQFGIGSSITSNDFQRLLDICETDAELFTHNFETRFGMVHPNFLGGPFSSFYQTVKNSNKPIIINIHNNSTDNVFFCSLVLAKPEVAKCIKDIDVKFWVGEISKENERVYQAIFGTPIKYPFFAIVGNVNNNFTVIEFINDLCTHTELIKKVNQAATHITNEIEKKRREVDMRNSERRIKEEQNELYQRSQREDKLKEQQKQEDAEMAIVSSASKLTTLQECRKHAIDTAANLPKEPDAKSTPKPTRIMITLPDGTKKQRFFDQNSKLELVFIWVRGFIAERFTDETFLDDSSPPLDTVGEAIIPWTIDAYELVSSYPKKSYTMKDANSSLLEVGLAPQGGILILQRMD